MKQRPLAAFTEVCAIGAQTPSTARFFFRKISTYTPGDRANEFDSKSFAPTS
jgi:hypothetical protein